MKYYKFTFHDVIMVLLIPILVFGNSFGIEVFSFWHYIVITFASGGYVVLALFASYQKYLADKKGLGRELAEINRIGDKR